MSKRRPIKIVSAGPSISGSVYSTRENRDLTARQKIEETIINLASALGHQTVKRAMMDDGTTMYSIDGGTFQRGANTILELSRSIVEGRDALSG